VGVKLEKILLIILGFELEVCMNQATSEKVSKEYTQSSDPGLLFNRT
jgi:hypothetical protein